MSNGSTISTRKQTLSPIIISLLDYNRTYNTINKSYVPASVIEMLRQKI